MMRVTLTSLGLKFFSMASSGTDTRTLMFVSLMPSGKSIGSTMTLIAAGLVRSGAGSAFEASFQNDLAWLE